MPASAPGGERLSSAILYAAIVAIWAGVLIPRWLRRDSSSGAPDASDTSGAFDASGGQAFGEAPAGPASGEEPHPPRRRNQRRDEGRGKQRKDSGDRREAPRDLGHRRVLSARRRLLGLLVLLAAGSGALAGTRMAAWWVVVPPSVMLLGYLPLLRAAAKADAERRVLAARPPMAYGPVADHSRYSRDLADPAPAAAHVAPFRDPAPAPPAHVIDISNYDDAIYDQYADAELRAVGD